MEQLIKAIEETLIKNEHRLEEVTFKENFIVIQFRPKTN